MVMDGQYSLLLMSMALIQDFVCGSCTQTHGKFNTTVRLKRNFISWLMDLLTDEMEEMMGRYVQKWEVRGMKAQFISQEHGMDYQCEDSCIHNFSAIMVSKVGFEVIILNSVENLIAILLSGRHITLSQGEFQVCKKLEDPMVCCLNWSGSLGFKREGFRADFLCL